jgi:carnosine N-methyltransferase
MDSGPWACDYEDPSEEEYHAGRLPRFSLQAGDFMDLYGHPQHAGQWHAVVTCWFIDAVPDIVQLIGTIHRMLRPGGVWTNFGPLLYHWVSDSCDTGDNNDHRFNSGMALPWEDIKLLLLHYGDLTFVDDDWVETTYVQRPNSMQKTTYSCKFFSIVKGEKAQTADTSIGNGETIDTVHKEHK